MPGVSLKLAPGFFLILDKNFKALCQVVLLAIKSIGEKVIL